MRTRRAVNLQQRMEGSDWGRAVLSAFLGITLVTVISFQLPNSHLRRELMRVTGSLGNASGLDQNWSVFASDPRRIVLEVEARLTYADGSSSVWEIPRSNDFVGVYWDYRWLKYAEHIRLDNNRLLWLPFAKWVAREKATGGRLVRVDLVRRWYDLLPLGLPDGQLRGPWREYRFFTLPVVSRESLSS